MHLVDFKNSEKSLGEMTFQERQERIAEIKDQAATFFKNQEYNEAIKLYIDAKKYLD